MPAIPHSRLKEGTRVRITSTRYQGQLGTVMSRNAHGARPNYSRVKIDNCTGSYVWFADAMLTEETAITKLSLGHYWVFMVSGEWICEDKRTGYTRKLHTSATESIETLLANKLAALHLLHWVEFEDAQPGNSSSG